MPPRRSYVNDHFAIQPHVAVLCNATGDALYCTKALEDLVAFAVHRCVPMPKPACHSKRSLYPAEVGRKTRSSALLVDV